MNPLIEFRLVPAAEIVMNQNLQFAPSVMIQNLQIVMITKG